MKIILSINKQRYKYKNKIRKKRDTQLSKKTFAKKKDVYIKNKFSFEDLEKYNLKKIFVFFVNEEMFNFEYIFFLKKRDTHLRKAFRSNKQD